MTTTTLAHRPVIVDRLASYERERATLRTLLLESQVRQAYERGDYRAVRLLAAPLADARQRASQEALAADVAEVIDLSEEALSPDLAEWQARFHPVRAPRADIPRPFVEPVKAGSQWTRCSLAGPVAAAASLSAVGALLVHALSGLVS